MKETNLIFIEHNKLLLENDLLYEQLSNYEKENLSLSQLDSIRSHQIKNYQNLTTSYQNEIKNLNKELSKKKKSLLGWQIGGVTVTFGLVVWLLSR